MFLASKPLAELASKKAYSTLVTASKHTQTMKQAQDRHFKLNAVHSILYIAGMSRIIEERSEKDLLRIKKCGYLFEPINSDKRDLTFREACNKIIHAKSIDFLEQKTFFNLSGGKKIEAVYFEAEVKLCGSKGKKEWKAVLDVVEFCRASLETVRYSY